MRQCVVLLAIESPDGGEGVGGGPHLEGEFSALHQSVGKSLMQTVAAGWKSGAWRVEVSRVEADA